MKSQWALLLGLVFAIIIAVFAVVNVDDVKVDYVFGQAQWPLILVILSSALLGALISISFAFFKMYNAGRNVSKSTKQLSDNNALIVEKDREIEQLRANLATSERHLEEAKSELTNARADAASHHDTSHLAFPNDPEIDSLNEHPKQDPPRNNLF